MHVAICNIEFWDYVMNSRHFDEKDVEYWKLKQSKLTIHSTCKAFTFIACLHRALQSGKHVIQEYSTNFQHMTTRARSLEQSMVQFFFFFVFPFLGGGEDY